MTKPQEPVRFANQIGFVDRSGPNTVIEFLCVLKGDAGQSEVRREVLLALPQEAVLDLVAKLGPPIPAGAGENGTPGPAFDWEKAGIIQRVFD